MIHLALADALKAWDVFWDGMAEEFFKVEDLQSYADEKHAQKSSLALWLEGDKEGSLKAIRAHRHEWAAQTTAKRVRKIRIHIVDEPLSEYLQWEIEHYKLVNIPIGGEEVYLVNRKNVPQYGLGDFMMFDGEKVAKSSYSPDGRLLGMDMYQNEPIIAFKEAKSLLMNFAKKLSI